MDVGGFGRSRVFFSCLFCPKANGTQPARQGDMEPSPTCSSCFGAEFGSLLGGVSLVSLTPTSTSMSLMSGSARLGPASRSTVGHSSLARERASVTFGRPEAGLRGWT